MGILNVLFCNKSNIAAVITAVLQQYNDIELNSNEWIESAYMPTPTIIEAAQALYRNHSVEEILREMMQRRLTYSRQLKPLMKLLK